MIACAGDVPTLEALAAVDLLRRHLPDLRVRFVNVVDLMRLQPESEHPHGMSDAEFDSLFTTDRPIVFAYHGYPWLIHRLTYRRTNHANLHVRGYKEEGTTTTPFDMVMLNDLDRFHLVIDVIDRVPGLGLSGRPRPPAHGGQADRGAGVHEARGRGPARCRDVGVAGLRVIGPARILVVNAGSSSLKLRVLDPDDVLVGSMDLGPIRTAGDVDSVAAAIGTLGPVDASGHRVVHGGTRFTGPARIDDEAIEEIARARRARAAAPAGRARRDRRRPAGAADGPGDRLLRHRVPRGHAGRRLDLRAARRLAGTLGHPPVRVPRAVPRLRVAAGGDDPGRRPQRTFGS